MSLNFDLKDIPLETRTVTATYDDPMHGITKGDRIMNPVTNALIWSTMAVGIGAISDGTSGDKYDTATIDEFELRVTMYEKLFGCFLSYNDDRGDQPITREVLEAHKGLRTNVSFEKRPAWLKRMADSVERDQAYARRCKREKEAQQAA